MMKEVCAQCLQPHIDPETGARTVVFSCFNQDQPLDRVDFPALNERLRQNGLPEKLTRLWIDRALKKLDERPPMRGGIAPAVPANSVAGTRLSTKSAFSRNAPGAALLI